MALAPRSVQNMPDCLRRLAMTVLQAASMTPEPTKRWSRRNAGAHAFAIAIEIVGFGLYGSALLILTGLREHAAQLYLSCVGGLVRILPPPAFGFRGHNGDSSAVHFRCTTRESRHR